MSHTPALSDLQAQYTLAERLHRAAEPHLPSSSRLRRARRLRRVADRLES